MHVRLCTMLCACVFRFGLGLHAHVTYSELYTCNMQDGSDTSTEAEAPSAAGSGKLASEGSSASETAHFEAIKEKKSSLENGIAAFNRCLPCP